MYFARSGSPGSRQAPAYSPGSARMWIGTVESLEFPRMRTLNEPALDQILDFCAEDPIERVFLEDVARRGLGRFTGLSEDGRLVALCHVGTNLGPPGSGCGAFAEVEGAGPARLVSREANSVGELWAAAN